MKLALYLAALLTVSAPNPASPANPAGPSLPPDALQAPATEAPDLRDRVDRALRDGLAADEFTRLSAEALDLADEAGSRSGFWNALGLAAELCRAGPAPEARAVRARALALLVREESDTLRWSALVTSRFLPAFERLPRADWAAELAEYDALLERLAADSTHARVQAELSYAQAFARVFINRRWDGLDEADRRGALERLAQLAERHGAQPLPGAADPELQTVGRRARSHTYELTQLYFGAPAPAASGVDLEGAPFDLADLRGQVVVIDFWTSFCQPCLALVPGVRALLEELGEEPLVYVGVNGDADRLAGRATAERVGMTWRNLWDSPASTEQSSSAGGRLGSAGPVAQAWNVPALGWPSVFVLDSAGRIRFKLRGQPQVEAELEDAIRLLLAERP